MPEWAQTILSVTGAAIGAYIAIRIELRFLWRDLGRIDDRVAGLEKNYTGPRRRWSDQPRGGVRRDS